MIYFLNNPVFLKLGNLSIEWLTIWGLISVHVVFLISREMLKREGTAYSYSEDLFIGTLVFGILFSRFVFCLMNDWNLYLSNPIQILDLRVGGFSLLGGLLGGLIFAELYCKMNRLSLLRTSDAIIPNLFCGYAIFFIAKEILYETYSFYIGGICLLGFILISILCRCSKKRKRGTLTYLSLIWFGIVSLFVKSIRNQYMCGIVILIIVGIIGILGWMERIMKKEKPLILFDLDGTLLDTQPAIFYSFTKLFEHYAPQTKVSEEILNSVLGPSLESSIKKYFPKEDTNKLVNEYRKHNIEAHGTLVKPMDGCKELLEKLKADGYRMAIISAKRKDIVELGCRQCGILSYFEVILGSEEVERHKPDPEGLLKACQLMKGSKDHAIYVGDSVSDIQAAKNAGMYSIGYIFNPARKQQLLDSKPNACVDNLLDIIEIVKEDHTWTANLM